MPERQFGPYRLVRQIAVGGMAEIHLAKTKGLAGFEKYVALKMIHPNFAEDDQFIQMLVDEAKIAVQLTHGNIAQTFDLGRVGDTYYITMEYIDGADLYKLLRRGSEIDLEMPLDVCAYVGKEVAGALDYAHRKKDTFGKSLGIVHRDVSPQNVLVSYAGEVKLVDFGIAKATSKAKQTAIGVIKGKYYYMSPEQAWGDPIDFRSDIFSAGIVLYEMITGQMLYLEEDLHRLLDMARRAEIAPPSTLRKGIPPQLERIVMHALSKVPGERYQSAGDFATDLERFLHAYSPVFTAAKLSTLLRQVVGEPVAIPDEGYESLEVRSGPQSTHPLPADAVLKPSEKEEIRDENSVIFRVNQLQGAPPQPVPVPSQQAPTAPVKKPNPTGGNPAIRPVPKTTRPSDPPIDLAPAPALRAPTARPSQPTPMRPSQMPKARPAEASTRQMDAAAPQSEDSGLLALAETPPPKLVKAAPKAMEVQKRAWADAAETQSIDDNLDDDGDEPQMGDRTIITAPTGTVPDAQHDVGGDDAHYNNPVDATMITAAPRRPDPVDDDVGNDTDAAIAAAIARDASGADDDDDDDEEATFVPEDDGPTIQRDFRDAQAGLKRKPAPQTAKQAPPAAPPAAARSSATPPTAAPVVPRAKSKTASSPGAPPALAAKIHSPAVSEIRKPRPSRRTPPGGMPSSGGSGSVLQAIVTAQPSEPMPTPRPTPMAQAQAQQPQQPQPPPLAPPPPAPQPAPYPYNSQPNMAAMQPGMVMPPLTATSPLAAPMSSPGFAQQGMQPMQPMPMQPMQPMQPDQSYPPPYGAPMNPLALGAPTPPPGMAVQSMPNVPPHLQPYAQMPAPPMGPTGYPMYPTPAGGAPMYPSPPGFPAMSPAAMYSSQPQQAMHPSLTGQLRLSEGDELPPNYKIGGGGRGYWKLVVIGLAVIAIAAGTTVLVLQKKNEGPSSGSIRFVSTPGNAEITFDGNRIADKTPFTLDGVPVGTRHDVTIELPHYQSDKRTVDMPKTGGEIEVTFALQPVVGRIIVACPTGTEVRVDGVLRLTGPGSINDVDLSAKKIELRAPGRQPYIRDLEWPSNGIISIDAKLQK